MPDLRRHQTHDLVKVVTGNHESRSAGLTPPPKPSVQDTMSRCIKYIPAQQDPMAGMSTEAARQNPIWLMLQDAGVLFTMLRYLPNIVLPIKASQADDELHLSISNARDTILQGLLFLMESVLLLVAVPTILILPGTLSIAAWSVCCMVVYLIVKPIQGPTVVYSNLSEEGRIKAEKHRDERWLFINGCMVGHAGLQKNVDRTAETFGRAVIGIHNRTYGLIADLIECIIQRAFSYQTTDVRVAHSHIKAILVDPTVNKVVLIGHSQGGIIVSQVLDQLFTELPADCMSKLEIYTFGSAASHFSNPLVSSPSEENTVNTSLSPAKTLLNRQNQPKHLISHIEHYANEKDMVPRWGVLHCTQDVLNNRYAGSVFVRVGASGHFFNQHYMDAMFPLTEKDTPGLLDGFLEQIIQVDEKMATRRESAAFSNAGLMRKQSGIEFGDGQVIPDVGTTGSNEGGGSIAEGDPVMTFARTNSGRLLAEEARGKSVRELSRLWRYQGGKSPQPSKMFLTGSKSLSTKAQYPNGKTGDSDKIQGLLTSMASGYGSDKSSSP